MAGTEFRCDACHGLVFTSEHTFGLHDQVCAHQLVAADGSTPHTEDVIRCPHCGGVYVYGVTAVGVLDGVGYRMGVAAREAAWAAWMAREENA